MKKIALLAALVFGVFYGTVAFTPAEARGGHYAGGHGSSHKGGKYENPSTGNHYTHPKQQ